MFQGFRKRWLYPVTGVAASVGLHFLAAAAVMGTIVWGLMAEINVGEPTTDLVVAAVTEQPAINASVAIDQHSEPGPILPNGTEVLASISDPRWQELVEPVPEERTAMAKVFVNTELMRIARDAEQRSADENLEKLAALGGTLENVSTEKGVDDINSQLNRVLGTEKRAERPAEEPVRGEFDFATAQLHDVLRGKDERGNFAFTAILVDSAGRKFETPMNASEGETAYRTMQLIKSNPLLERVYRGVVMSMLDQVLKGSQ
jgi:hypothetical protein